MYKNNICMYKYIHTHTKKNNKRLNVQCSPFVCHLGKKLCFATFARWQQNETSKYTAK